jgi:asparagine synthase (glutamine-hydrolysing)
MSAICGCVDFSGTGPRPTATIAPMMAALEPLGRDDGGTWSKGPVALGHRLTHTTPESIGERLPLEHRASGCVITADARIDNRGELFDALSVDRERRGAMADSELILLAYLRWGEKCLERLLGDFAFAIWDGRSQQLFCARDFIGAKPFYHFTDGTRCSFASTLEALLHSPRVPEKLDLAYIRAYLEQPYFVHPERSFWEGVRKLRPAHAQVLGRAGSRTWAYWSPKQTKCIRYRHDQDYVDHLSELLEGAVNCRLRSAFPVGSHLSGGLDSSSIAVLAARSLRQSGKMLHAFCWAPAPAADDYPLADERADVEVICRQEGITPHYAPVTPGDLIEARTRNSALHPSEMLLWELPVVRMAINEKVRVMLSGWGGDEFAAFNGRGYFAELLLQGRWVTLARELRNKSSLHDVPVHRLLRSRVLLPLVPDALLARLRPDLPDAPRRLPLPDCLGAEFAASLRSVPPLRGRHLRERVGVRANQIALYHHCHLSERSESWAEHGARHGVEYRYPLLDQRIVEFALGVPPHLYQKDGWKRSLFRHAVQSLLPRETVWKPMKSDPAKDRWISSIQEETELMLADVLNDRLEKMRSAGYLDAEAIIARHLKSMRAEHDTNHRGSGSLDPLWLAFLPGPHPIPKSHLRSQTNSDQR